MGNWYNLADLLVHAHEIGCTLATKHLSDEEILTGLKNLALQLGRTPTTNDVTAASKLGKCASSRTFYLRFGSYNAAVEAAGLVANSSRGIYTKKYTRDELITQLHRLQTEYSRPPTCDIVEENAKLGLCASTGTFQSTFGSFSQALLTAGILQIFSKDDVIRFLQESFAGGTLRSLAEISELQPLSHHRSSITVLIETFGSVEAGLEAAGLRIITKEDRLNARKQQWILSLQEAFAELGHIPSYTDMFNRFEASKALHPSSIGRLFGSFAHGLQAAGFDVNLRPPPPPKVYGPPKPKPSYPYDRPFSQEKLIAQLKLFADKHGRAPTRNEMEWSSQHRDGLATLVTFEKYFGSWRNALEAAGLEFVSSTKPKPTRQELIDQLKLIRSWLGRLPSSSDIPKGYHSYQIFAQEFGSWVEALDAAGLLSEKDKATDEELLRDLHILICETGYSPPARKAINDAAHVGKMAHYIIYRKRFGNLRAASSLAFQLVSGT